MHGSEATNSILTFDQVEERLIEAMLVCWRSPDRERGWLRVRSLWPEVMRETSAGDYDARGGEGTSSDVALRPAALTRREVADMEEAFGWLSAVQGADRKIIGLAITALARGDKQVPWSRLLRPMGLTRGTDGLRKRYTRAMSRVTQAANAAEMQGVEAVKP
ncbi:MAG: hypothetical protein FJ335_02835 [Sphingomonadales bacterium]|nr:hypothetical protein [Sphingomonadales bacterium]